MKWYKYDIRDMNDAEYEYWFSLMLPSKKERINSFRFDDDKKRSVAGEMLAKKAISIETGITADTIVLSTSRCGKPFVDGIDIEFNISHSGNMVVCAVDYIPIGIDIEIIRPIDLNIAKLIFTEKELLFLFDGTIDNQFFKYTDDADLLKRFFTIWTKKEAALKRTGVGISMNSAEVECKCSNFFFDDYVVAIST